MLSHAQLALTLRSARPDDERRLTELARLDSARPLDGDVLVAEADSTPVAAIDVVSGRLVADPFRPTAAEANLLRARAEQMRSRRHDRRRAFGRLAGLAR